MAVYFVQCGTAGPIKIGVARNVDARLADLQVANAELLSLLAVLEHGDEELEVRLHDRFSAGRIRGEWFRRDTPGLLDLIGALLRDEIPAWVLPPSTEFEAACLSCGYSVEPEVARHGLRLCWRCAKAEEMHRPSGTF